MEWTPEDPAFLHFLHESMYHAYVFCSIAGEMIV